MNLPSQFFRAGAGAVIINGQGLVLALERSDAPGAWQLPQGGLDRDEEPLTAAFREVQEETGLEAEKLILLSSCPEPLAYELPSAFRREKTGRGQVLYWFLFKLTGGDRGIQTEPGGEFRSWRWMFFADLVERTVDFRKPVYHQLAACFRAYLCSPLGEKQL